MQLALVEYTQWLKSYGAICYHLLFLLLRIQQGSGLVMRMYIYLTNPISIFTKFSVHAT